MFLAVGANGARITSDDGRSWPSDAGGESEVNYTVATFGAGKFVTIGKRGPTSYFAHSSSGTSWDETEVKTGHGGGITGVVYGNEKFIAFAGDAVTVGKADPRVYLSDDGTSWSDAIGIPGKFVLRRAAYGNDTWVAVGDRGRIATSKDGEEWEDVPDTKAINTLIDIAFGNGIFVGTGLHGLRMYSDDGKKWSEPEIGTEGEHINSILWTGSAFVGVGDGGTYGSTDGKTWERVENENAPTFATYGNNLFVGVAWKGRILVSPDANKWEEVYKSSSNFEAITYGDL